MGSNRSRVQSQTHLLDRTRKANHGVRQSIPASVTTLTCLSAQRVTVARPKNESKEDKKARKHAVKAERQQRRSEKKATKEQFSSEAKRQNQTLVNKEKTRARKL